MENVYDKPKLQTTKNSRQLSLWQRDVGQPDEDQNEQQQQQPANYSSENSEIARCPGCAAQNSLFMVFCVSYFMQRAKFRYAGMPSEVALNLQ